MPQSGVRDCQTFAGRSIVCRTRVGKVPAIRLIRLWQGVVIVQNILTPAPAHALQVQLVANVALVHLSLQMLCYAVRCLKLLWCASLVIPPPQVLPEGPAPRPQDRVPV
jgi:hypothetical protein